MQHEFMRCIAQSKQQAFVAVIRTYIITGKKLKCCRQLNGFVTTIMEKTEFSRERFVSEVRLTTLRRAHSEYRMKESASRADIAKARMLQSDGSYAPAVRKKGGVARRCQTEFMDLANGQRVGAPRGKKPVKMVLKSRPDSV